MQDFVILVDNLDNNLGLMKKLEAHKLGMLHRAFSIFILDSNGKLIIQQRAASKYHCPLLWANTCCSHPRKSETIIQAANRRLMEEMGMVCELKEIFTTTYNLYLPNNLVENEFNHVLLGITDELPIINKNEVEQYKKESIISIYYDSLNNPEKYAPWFKFILPKFFAYIN